VPGDARRHRAERVRGRSRGWPPPKPSPPFVSTPYEWTNTQNFVGIAPSGAASAGAPYSSELAWDALPTFNDGLNASGLSIGALWLEPGANYPRTSHTAGNYELSYLDFPAWVLGTCTSVEDIKTALIGPDALFTVVGPAPSNTDNFYVPLHYVATDNTGASVVVEFVGPTGDAEVAKGGTTTIYDSNGVMTNAPEYAWHLVNVENYAHLSLVGAATTKTGGGGGKPLVGGGLQGLPGDPQSVSRFIKAWYMSQGFSQMQAKGGTNTWLPAPGGQAPTNDDPEGFAYAEQTAVLAAVQLVQIAMGTPYGMLLDYQENSSTDLTVGDWTMWTCARDHTNVAYYFMSGLSGILTKIDVKALFASSESIPPYPNNLTLPVLPQPDIDWCVDATKDLVSAT
jgi:penicillin V acylase-like amidase (Ntn superfamily)